MSLQTGLLEQAGTADGTGPTDPLSPPLDASREVAAPEVPPRQEGVGLAGGEGEAGQLGALVAQLQQMGTQDAASRDQALARLGAGLPPQLGEALKVVAMLEPAELVGVAGAVEAAQRGEPPPPEAVGAAYKVFTQLPPESKASVVSMLPPETQSMATAFVNAPPLESAEVEGVARAVEAVQRGEPPPADAFGTACKIVVARPVLHCPPLANPKCITIADKVFTQLPPESKTSVVLMLPPEAQSIASAVVSLPVLETETVVGLATGVLGLRGTTDLASADPAAIAALHTQLKKLPPAVTHLLVEQLPKESQDLAAAAIELGSGLEEVEVAELVKGFQSGKGKDAAEVAKQQYWKAAKTISFSELRRVSRWAKQSPLSLQVLAFLGGVLLLFASVLSLFLSLARFDLAIMIIQLCKIRLYRLQT